MIHPIFLFLFIIQFNFCLFGQSTNVDPSELMFLFDQDKMMSNNIKSAEASIAYKYDLEMIHKTKNFIVFEFNKSGLIKTIIEIIPSKKRVDSVVSNYTRNNSGQVVMKVKSDPRYTYVEIMDYNLNGMVNHEFYQMKKPIVWSDNLNDQNLMWSDSIHYGENNTSIFNRYGKMYRKQHVDRNEKNQLIKTGHFDQSGRWFKSVTYTYDLNKLTEIEELNGYEWMFNWKKKFEYDENGLSKIAYYKNNELEYIRKLSYNSNGLLELDLKRNETNKKMTILQIEYFK